MAFNQFNWNNYKQTKSFENFCSLFETIEQRALENKYFDKEIFDIYLEWIEDTQKAEPLKSIEDAYNEFFQGILLGEIRSLPEYENKSKNTPDDDDFKKWIFEKWLEQRKETKKKKEITLDEFITFYIAEISLAFYKGYPEYFFPYLFKTKIFQNINGQNLDLSFNLFKNICEEFEIDLPEAPARNNYFDKANYYNEINTLLHEFRTKHNLSPMELCAFLYDYAPQYLENNRDKELPIPLRVWLIKAAQGNELDFELIENADTNFRSYWSGNIKTKRGDILLMYCVSPRSFIHSIWRSNEDGFTDPFFYYRNQTEICKKISIPQIGFKELQGSPIISQKNEMKANLQTPTGGIEFTYQEFEEIKELLKQKGFDTSILPELPKSEISIEQNLLNERDVEIKFLEPLLIELGCKKTDWIRQYTTQIGTRERIIPDYILGLKNNKAELIIEAKFRYHDATQKEKEKHFKQAYSYALHFQSPKLVIADKNGITAFHNHKGNYDKEQNTFYSWTNLKKADYFQELKKYLSFSH